MPFVTDTHPLVWYMTGDPKLSAKTKKIFQEVDDFRDQIFIPCIVLFELLYLAEKKKIEPSFDDILAMLPKSENYRVEPLCLPVIRNIQQVPRDKVRDPWDRLVVATSLHLRLPLITRDENLRDIGFDVVW
jgi:PIN domain nuclease of toxin-antitoxin system